MSSLRFYRELGDEIIQNPDFIHDYQRLQSVSGPAKDHQKDLGLYGRLLRSASILACSDKEDHRIIALEIAGTMIEDESANDVVRASSELMFLRLGNFPTLEMSISKYGDYLSVLDGNETTKVPIGLSMEIVGKKLANQFLIADKRVFLIDFQRKVVNLLLQGKNISISAPTSAGKSYVLTRYAIDVLKKKEEYTVVYIVPTRALIAQVQKEFRNALEDYSVDDANIFTTSWEIVGEGRKPYSKAIMILTQERLQAVESKTDNLPVDLIIVDEAQKIEEGARGIILEESVQEIIDSNPDAQVVFISPFTENPEKLGSVFYCGEVEVVRTTFSPVSQRIYQVDIDKKDVDISLVSQELKRKLPVAKFQAKKTIPETYKRKAWVATNVAEPGSTMVYCNGPADCRRTARAIAETSPAKDVGADVSEVIKFLSKHIHPKYFLIDYLEKGVGYHYGNMPGSVRTSMESLFSNKKIDRICCTSTLMEGVNFPARNIVIHKPKTGLIHMEELPFWNLAGRAGRWMKDFCGNIYCIDVEEWEGYRPGLEKGGHTIRSSMEDVIREKKELIVKHLRRYERYMKARNEDVEAAVTRFIINEVQRGNEEFVGQLLERDSSIDAGDLEQIIDLVNEIVEDLDMQASLILQNRSVDPRLQNDLYKHVKSLDLPPIPPHPVKFEFYSSLEAILSMTNNFLKRGHKPGYIRKIALMTTRWVREETLGEIIGQNVEYREEKSGKDLSRDEINKEIEDTMKLINTEISFRFCRDISCYTNILKSVLGSSDLDMEMIENLGYYVEIGAHKPTTLTLLNNGIPRSIAILLSRNLPHDIQDFEECRRLMKKDYGAIRRDIPSVILKELVDLEE